MALSHPRRRAALIVLLVALLLAGGFGTAAATPRARNRPAGHGGRGSGQPPGGVTRYVPSRAGSICSPSEAIELQIQQLDASQQSLTQQLAALAMQIRHLSVNAYIGGVELVIFDVEEATDYLFLSGAERAGRGSAGAHRGVRTAAGPGGAGRGPTHHPAR